MSSNEGEQADRILRSFIRRVPTSDIPFHDRAENDMKTFIIDLLDELKDVFRNEGIEMIEKTRTVTDWNGLVLKIKERSIPVLFSLDICLIPKLWLWIRQIRQIRQLSNLCKPS